MRVRSARTGLACALLALALSAVVLGGDLPCLRVSLPPVMGSLPIAFAARWRLFQAHGVDVEVVALNDDSARLRALAAREIDGMVCDVTTAIRLYASGTDVVITSTIYQPPRQGALAILTTNCMAASKGITSLASLFSPAPPHKPCAISFTTQSDVEFVMDAVLAGIGLTMDGGALYAHVDNLPNLAMRLAIGGVEAAVLPEPYVTYMAHVPPSLTLGCSVVRLLDFAGTQLPPSVIVFRRDVQQTADAPIAAFYAALREAVTRMNAMTASQTVSEGVDVVLSLGFFPGATRASIPRSVLDYLQIPRFPLPGRLDPDLFGAILDWMHRKHYTWKSLAYGQLTTMRYVP